MAEAIIGTQERSRAWRLVAALLILAFSFQSILVQTHIHKPAPIVAAAVSHHVGPAGSTGENSPLDCPFCQVVNHAGSFLFLDVSLSLLASQWAEMVVPRHLLPDITPVANHHWRSRAPPSP